MKRMGIAAFALLLMIFPSDALAETKTFIKEYTYQASEADSKLSSRVIALEQVKRLLLEELGTYLESHTEVVNYQLTTDQIKAWTAGIVSTQIIKEKWDGKRYWIKARIKADPEEVINSINFLRKDKESKHELENIRQRSDAALSEIKKIKNELNGTKKNQAIIAQYNEAIKKITITNWFEKGYAASISGNYNEAISAYDKAIELNPNEPYSYYNRGTVYGKLNDYGRAISDFDSAIELDPNFAAAYSNRGFARYLLANNNIDPKTNYSYSLKDLNKAILLNPQSATAYTNRGSLNLILGFIENALNDFNKAIEIDPSYALPYAKKGLLYHARGYMTEALINYNRAIELDPIEPNIYCLRAATHEALKDYDKANDDLRIAARMGYKHAQDLLIKRGIKW